MSVNQALAWQILPDDGSTKVAAYNIALCILAGGFDNSTIIAQGDNGGMVIVNPQGVSNQTIANRVIMLCRERFGNNITLSSYRYSNYEDYYTPIANIVEALDNVDLFPEFSRDTYDPAQYNYLAANNGSYVDGTFINSKTSLQKRDKYGAYYCMSVSNERDCESDELFYTYSDICQDDKMLPFYSYKVYNPQPEPLITNVWPHHRCTGGDEHTDFVSVWTWTSCNARTTYSWYGDFKGDPCFTHESLAECSQWRVDEWAGYFVANAINWGGKW